MRIAGFKTPHDIITNIDSFYVLFPPVFMFCVAFVPFVLKSGPPPEPF